MDREDEVTAETQVLREHIARLEARLKELEELEQKRTKQKAEQE